MDHGAVMKFSESEEVMRMMKMMVVMMNTEIFEYKCMKRPNLSIDS